jgi:hypothetical protein
MTSTQVNADNKRITALHRWQQWIEAWYLAYGLLGATAAGMLPTFLCTPY